MIKRHSFTATYDFFDGNRHCADADDTTYNATSVNMGGSNYSNDASIYNFLAETSGTYFINLSPITEPDTGSYELLIATTAIPEPGSIFVILAATSALALTSRRTRFHAPVCARPKT